MLCVVTISKSLLTKKDPLSASGITSLMSDIKKPADKELESVETIFPLNSAILNDFIVLIPAGADAPGTRTLSTEFSGNDNSQSYLKNKPMTYKYLYTIPTEDFQ